MYAKSKCWGAKAVRPQTAKCERAGKRRLKYKLPSKCVQVPIEDYLKEKQ